MANKDDYLTYYREFFENFAQTINPNDQLPVKLASYKFVNLEVVGGIIDWTTQYLTQKKCPPNLMAPLIKIVIEEMRKDCKKHPTSCGFVPSDNAYEPLKLMQTVMAKMNEVCLRYLDNSQLCSLPAPGSLFFATSVYALKNSRRRMEDRHVVIHDLNTMFNIQEVNPSSYYAIFDGHAGYEAAAYSSAHLHQFLAENECFISNPEQALYDAFCKTDSLFINKCRVEDLSGGTTAVVALLRPKEKTLYVAWVGDSQALLAKQGKILQIVYPHRPNRQDEKERIEEQGGSVVKWGTWRVNGQLAVSRAIGDVDYKPYVTAAPDIREISLDGGEDFLILACDGLWDFVTEDSAARTVYDLVAENPDDTDRISQHLVQLSKEQGSLDNISVIVVFLREPSKIPAEAHWANRNITSVAMDASVDNANNPFTISNGATPDNIISQKSEGLLLNLTDNFKRNGTDISPTAGFYVKEKSNGKRTASEFDEDDFGPETDVDVVDDALAAEPAKGFGDVFSNNNPDEGVYNPFMERQEKATLEMELELLKQDHEELEEQRLAREETPTPPADTVHDVSALVDNIADSESEDEWNYYKGDEANKENITPQPNREVAEVPEEDENMSQLNPNAAEFVPVSPTRSIPSPACRSILNDQVISQSPRRPASDIDINVPNPVEFEKEVKSRPSDFDSYSNGHNESEHNITPPDLMDNLLNGKNIDEIPEFQPGSTPRKNAPSEEFHFGPNAAPFTPARLLDQSEAAISTRAVYGDESSATLGTSFNESVSSQDTAADINLLNRESDPMSMSFYAERGDANPFDLNEVHILPDNIDEFLNKPESTSLLNDTISDLPEHQPLGDHKKTDKLTLNNDDAIQVTDLDKRSYDDEKELASPLEPEKESSETEKDLLGGGEECDLSNISKSTNENLIDRPFCTTFENLKTPEVDSLPCDVELISVESANTRSNTASPKPLSSYEEVSKSPLIESSQVNDLLPSQPESLPRDVEFISTQLSSPNLSLAHEKDENASQPETSEFVESEIEKSICSLPPDTSEAGLPHSQQAAVITSQSAPSEASEVNDLLQAEIYMSDSESSLPRTYETSNLSKPESDILRTESPLPEVAEALGSVSPVTDLAERMQTEHLLPQSPMEEVRQLTQSETLTANDLEAELLPVSERVDLEMPICDLSSKSLITEHENFETSPVCELPVLRSPISEHATPKFTICDTIVETIPFDQSESKPLNPDDIKDVSNLTPHLVSVPSEETAVSPNSPQEDICDYTKPGDIKHAQLHFDEISHLEKKLPESEEDFNAEDVIDQAQEHFEDICRPKKDVGVGLSVSSELDVITSSLRNEIHSPVHTPLPGQTVEDTFLPDEFSPVIDRAQNISGVVQEPNLEAASPSVAPKSGSIEVSEAATDNESANETKVSSSLNSLLPEEDVPSIQSLTIQEFDDVKKSVDQIDDQLGERPSERAYNYSLHLDHPLSTCVYPLSTETGEQIEIKTENISPEYAEQAIVTPSEESKQDDVPTAPPLEEPAREQLSVQEEQKERSVVENVGAATSVAAAAAICAAVTANTEKDEKKKPASPIKKLSATKSATSKGNTRASAPLKVASRLSASPKSAAAKTGTAKSTTISAPKQTPAKLSPRARPVTATKSAETKSTINGDIKPSARLTSTSRKITETPTLVKSTTSRPATAGATKLSPTKPATARLTAPRPTTAPRTSSTTRTTTLAATSTAAKSRPTTLPNKTATSSTASKINTVTESPMKTTPKMTSVPKTKPAVPLSKPKAPLSKIISNAPDTEKQNKESANKLTASRTVTGTRTVAATPKTTTSTIRKVENKTIGGTRTRKTTTTTTTTKSTTAKKPAEIVKNIGGSKTKTTKIEKPKENTISTVITEEITVVNSTSSVINGEPQLIKDNSPVDNKLVVENVIQPNTAD